MTEAENNMEILAKIKSEIMESCETKTYRFNEEVSTNQYLASVGDYVIECMKKGFVDIIQIPFLKAILPDKEIFLIFEKDSDSGKYSYTIDENFVPPTVYSIDIKLNDQ